MSSIGWPRSGQAAVSFAMRSARAFIAARVVSYGIAFEGKAQTLPSGIEPKPEAAPPLAVRTTQSTFRSVTRSTTTPPNLMGTR